MKIDFLKKKKVFTKNNVQPNPDTYWVIIFCVGLILTLASFVFGFYLFMKINREDAYISAPASKELDKISSERIGKSLKVFSDRKNISIQILNEGTGIVDPSL